MWVKKNIPISPSSSAGGTSASTENPSGYAPHSTSSEPFTIAPAQAIEKIKQQNKKQLNLDKSDALKQKMASDLMANPSAAYKASYLNALEKQGYDRIALEGFASNLENQQETITPAEYESLTANGQSIPEGVKVEQPIEHIMGDPTAIGQWAYNFINKTGENIQSGIKGFAKGIEEMQAPPNVQDIMNEDYKKVLTAQAKKLVHGALGTTTGGGKVIFNVLPAAVAFNASMDAINTTAEKTLSAEGAKKVETVTSLPFTMATRTADLLGIKPEEGSSGAMVIELLDLIGGGKVIHGITKGAEMFKDIKSIKDLQDLSQKAAENKLTPEEQQQFEAYNELLPKVKLEDIKQAAEEKGTPESLELASKIDAKLKEQPASEVDQLHDKLAELQSEAQTPEFANMPKEAQDAILNGIDETTNQIKAKEGEDLMNSAAEAHKEGEFADINNKIETLKASTEEKPVAVQEAIGKTIADLEARKSELSPPIEIKQEQQEIANLEAKVLDESATEEDIKQLDKLKTQEHAIQKFSPGKIFPSTQEGIGKPRSERSTLESGIEGIKTPEEIRQEEVRTPIEAEKQIINPELANEKPTTEVPESVSQRFHREITDVDTRNEEVTSELRRRIDEARKNIPIGEKDTRQVDDKVLFDYAKETNTWIDDFKSLGDKFPGGTEHDIVFDKDNQKLYKKNNLSNYTSIDQFFDKIKLHNELFPNTPYKFEGFTGLEKGLHGPFVEPVFSQDFIKGAEEASVIETGDYMESLGFERVDAHTYKKGNIEVSDLRPRNVLKDADGNIHVIDAEFKEIFPKASEGKVPPAKPPVNEGKTYSESKGSTELTHEAIDIDRKKLGLEPIDKMSYDNKADFKEASETYKDEHILLAQKLANSRTPATRKEAYKISLGIVDLKSKLKSAENKINKALESGDEKSKEDAYVERGIIELQLDTAHQALKNATSEAGRVLRLAQDAIKEDMSLDNTLRTAKSYSKDGKLSEKQRETFEKIVGRLEAAEKDLKIREEEISKIKAQKVVDELAIEEKIKSGVESEVEKINKKLPSATREKADKAIKAIESFQAKIRANNYSSVPIAIIDTALTTIKLAIKAGVKVADAVEMGIEKVKELHGKWEKEDQFRKDMLDELKKKSINTSEKGAIKLTPEGKIKGLNGIVKELIKKGFTDINEIVKEVKKDVPDMTEREIRDEISGYGKVSELSQDPINVKLREVKRVGKLITQKERALANEELLRSGLQRDKPTAKELEIQKEINDILRENQMKTERIPKTDAQWKTLLDRYKTRLKNQIDELQAKADREDFEVKKREALKMDAESLELKRKIDKLKGERAKEIEKIRLSNRSPFEKIADTTIKALRFSILTGVITPALKLGVGAGAVRSFLANPMETLVTAAWSKIPGLRKIAEQSPRYSGELSGPLAKGISEWWSKGTKEDIKNIINGGKQEMDLRYGKNDQLPPNLWEIFHKILKTPAKRAEFATSMEMNLNWEAKQKNELGEYNDITDPVVQLRAAKRALLDSDRAIFMQDNPISTAYKMGLKGLEREMKDGSQGGKIISKMLQSDMLIVKVPTNYVLESASYVPGIGALKAGTAALARSLKGEMNKLTPEQADYMSRAITKQLTGAVLFGIGYYAYKNMGGNYVPNQPSKEKPKAGEMKVGDIHIPHALQHSTMVQAMQLGATMAHAEDFYKKAGDESKTDSYITMLKSLVRQNPFSQEAESTTKALNSTTSKTMWAATLVSKLTTPAKWFAEHFDTDANGEPIKRKPQTWSEVLKMNIPGLRQQVTTAWDLIDAKRTELTKIQTLENDLEKVRDKIKNDPNNNKYREDKNKIKEEINDLKEANKNQKLEKFEIDEKQYLELAKALGKTPHRKKSVTKDEEKIYNTLKFPK